MKKLLIGLGVMTLLGAGCASEQATSSVNENSVAQPVVDTAPIAPPTGLKGNEYTSFKTDLNGDGVLDSITAVLHRVAPDPDMQEAVTLTVNGVSVIVPGTNPAGFFGIVDINTSDKQKEIAVLDNGQSTDFTTSYYAYDGKTLTLIGTIPAPYEGDTKFDGKGTVTSSARAMGDTVLDTWFFVDTHSLDATGKLVEVPKTFYPDASGGQVLTAKVIVTLQKSPTDPTIVATLKPGDKLTVLGGDNTKWYEATSGKITGWFDVTKVGGELLHMEDIFDGLNEAD